MKTYCKFNACGFLRNLSDYVCASVFICVYMYLDNKVRQHNVLF